MYEISVLTTILYGIVKFIENSNYFHKYVKKGMENNDHMKGALGQFYSYTEQAVPGEPHHDDEIRDMI